MVSRVNCSTGAITNFASTGLSMPIDFAFDSSYVYVLDHTNNNISKFDFSGNLVNGDFITGLYSPSSMILFENYFYVMNQGFLPDIGYDPYVYLNGVVFKISESGEKTNIIGLNNGNFITIDTSRKCLYASGIFENISGIFKSKFILDQEYIFKNNTLNSFNYLGYNTLTVKNTNTQTIIDSSSIQINLLP